MNKSRKQKYMEKFRWIIMGAYFAGIVFPVVFSGNNFSLLRSYAFEKKQARIYNAETASIDHADMEIKQIEWELDMDGFVQYFTNDSEKYDSSWWTFYENINAPGIYQIECKKMSGCKTDGGGYGMMFGASDTDNYAFYHIELETTGHYALFKHRNKKEGYITIKDWTKSEKLFTGYNTINSLKVIKDGPSYTVFLNDNQVYQFTDKEITGDRMGYWVEISSESVESFPNVPVDVRFRQK